MINFWELLLLAFTPALSVWIISRLDGSEVFQSNKSARNERKKLTATFLNNTGIAFIAAAIASIFVGADFLKPITFTTNQDLNRVLFAWIAVGIGVGLHFVGRLILGQLED